MQCYCGSTTLFEQCCQPFLRGRKKPESAQLLMRSRFSAYAVKNGQYIYDTYARESKKGQTLEEIQNWANECTWLALEINNFDETTVDFSAYYIIDNQLCHLREVSRFVLETRSIDDQLHWLYLDGEITHHEEISKVKRNEICPCNKYPTRFATAKKKKYKHCCAK